MLWPFDLAGWSLWRRICGSAMLAGRGGRVRAHGRLGPGEGGLRLRPQDGHARRARPGQHRIGKGGTEMSPTLTITEVARLARTMTWKWAAVDLFHGGAKAGILGDPNAENSLGGGEANHLAHVYAPSSEGGQRADTARYGEPAGTTTRCSSCWFWC
jgi:hypothetical protein